MPTIPFISVQGHFRWKVWRIASALFTFHSLPPRKLLTGC